MSGTIKSSLTLPKRADLYRALAQNFPNGAVLLYDRELRYTLADGMGLSEIGLSSEMLEGKTIWETFPQDVCQVIEPRYRAALAGEASNFEVAYAGRVYQVHVLPIWDDLGEISSGMVMTQDVTAQKRGEERLRQSQQRYEQLVNTIDGVVWEGDAKTFQYYFVSQQAERLLGYPVERWTSEPTFWSDHIHPEDRQWALNFCALSTAQQRDHVFEYRMMAADGRVVWLRDIVTVVVENDQPVALRGVMVDITESKRAEEEIHEREQQYRSIFESVSDGLFINSYADGSLVDFNPAAARMHGYSQEEFRRLHPTDFIHPDSLHLLNEYLETVKAGGVFRSHAVDVRRDGSTFPVEVLGTSFIYKGQPHALGVVRDVTEEVEAYQRLEERVAQRTQELQTLLEISRNVASNLDLKSLLETVFEQLKKVVDFTALTVWMVESGDELVIIEYQGPLSREKVFEAWNGRFHLSDIDPLRQVEPLIIPDVRADTPLAKLWREDMLAQFGEIPSYISTWMSIPLLVKNQTIGLISLHHEQVNYYTARHADLAFALASHAAIAIENARLYEKAQRLAALQERQKLARELHDSVSQALYGIALGSRTARIAADKDDFRRENILEPLDYVLSLAEAGLAEMRALIFELRPESLENEGLVAALTKQTDALGARHQIQIETSFCGEPQLSLEAKETLYRVAQESLHNVVKHARATQVSLQLGSDKRQVTLEIQDNGIGFDPQGSYPGHLGLRSMRERAERMGGNLVVESEPGNGTRVLMRVPLNS